MDFFQDVGYTLRMSNSFDVVLYESIQRRHAFTVVIDARRKYFSRSNARNSLVET